MGAQWEPQTCDPAALLQALRRDLRALEDDARALAAELEDATDWNPGQGSLQQLEGRFLCLAGMYKAHSQVSVMRSLHLGLILPRARQDGF